MNGHHPPGTVGDRGLNPVRGDTGCFRIAVHEYGHSPHARDDSTGRGDEGDSRNQDLVTGLDAAGHQDQFQGNRTIAHTNAVPGIVILSKRPLELLTCGSMRLSASAICDNILMLRG